MQNDVKSGMYDHKEANASGIPKKVLDHLEIRPGKTGGATVEHHFTSMLHPVENHVFGKQEGDKMMAHIGKNAKMLMPEKGNSTAEPDEVEGAEA